MRCSTSAERRTFGLETRPILAASASEKGHSPVTRIERRTPRDQTSEGGAWYASPRRISAEAKDCKVSRESTTFSGSKRLQKRLTVVPWNRW